MLGVAVVTATAPTTIDVLVDPTVSAPAEATVTCDPAIGLQFCTAGVRPRLGAVGASVGLVVEPTHVWGQRLIFEIVSEDGGARLGARAFLEVVQDAEAPWAAHPSCEFATSPRAHFSGRFTINRYDPADAASMHGHAELDVDGLPATIVF